LPQVGHGFFEARDEFAQLGLVPFCHGKTLSGSRFPGCAAGLRGEWISRTTVGMTFAQVMPRPAGPPPRAAVPMSP
jgi:hypothetical protein